MDFQSLQKLRFFLAIVFPVVGRSLITPEQAEEWLERHPRLKSPLVHLRDSKVGANLRHANTAFPALGTIVVAPVRPGAAVVFTMVHTVGDRERQWDLARALQSPPR